MNLQTQKKQVIESNKYNYDFIINNKKNDEIYKRIRFVINDLRDSYKIDSYKGIIDINFNEIFCYNKTLINYDEYYSKEIKYLNINNKKLLNLLKRTCGGKIEYVEKNKKLIKKKLKEMSFKLGELGIKKTRRTFVCDSEMYNTLNRESFYGFYIIKSDNVKGGMIFHEYSVFVMYDTKMENVFYESEIIKGNVEIVEVLNTIKTSYIKRFEKGTYMIKFKIDKK